MSRVEDVTADYALQSAGLAKFSDLDWSRFERIAIPVPRAARGNTLTCIVVALVMSETWLGLLRGFRTADLIDFLRCRGRLLVSVMHFVGPAVAEA